MNILLFGGNLLLTDKQTVHPELYIEIRNIKLKT